MNYKFDGIPISSLGASPVLSGQAMALHGMFDLPKRIGTTEHNWGTSIEPFVEEEDIELDGRALTLHVAVKTGNLTAFTQTCIACTELSTDYDTYDVVCKDEIVVNPVSENMCIVTVNFWQDEYLLDPAPDYPSYTGSYRMDEFDLKKDFGVVVAQTSDIFNTAKRIEIPTTKLYEKTQYRGSGSVSFRCAMIGSSVAVVRDNMKRFHSLMMAPGTRMFVTPKATIELYFKDGLTVNAVKENILQFTLKGVSV